MTADKLIENVPKTLEIVLADPWKVFAFAALLVLCVLLYVIWDSRIILTEKIFPTKQDIELNVGAFDANANRTRTILSAKELILWKVSFQTNERIVLSTWPPNGTSGSAQIFTNRAEDNAEIIKLLTQPVSCSLLRPSSLIGLQLQERGTVWTCQTPIYGNFGTPIGFLLATYQQEPENQQIPLILLANQLKRP